jgi:hypothetical protein
VFWELAGEFVVGPSTASIPRGEAATFGASLDTAVCGRELSSCGVEDDCGRDCGGGVGFGAAAAGAGIDKGGVGVGGGGIIPFGGPYCMMGRKVEGGGGGGFGSLTANMAASKT